MRGIIDSHAHLEEIQSLDQALAEARSANVIGIVAVGSDRGSNQKALDIARSHDSLVFPAVGLHPWSIKENEIEHDFEFIETHADESVGIGEVGLDYHKKVILSASKELQKRVLVEILKIAAKHSKPVIVHSRYAWRDSLSLVESAGIKNAVFHWFTGPSSVLRNILADGYYLSATPAVEYHEEHRRAVRETSLDRLLLETDSPVVYGRGTPSEFEARPADVVRSLRGAAMLKQMDEQDIATATTENATKLFGLRL